MSGATKKCHLCNVKQETDDALNTHYYKAHSATYCCRYCRQQFVSQQELYRHIKAEHKRGQRIPCDFCDYVNKDALAEIFVHIKTAHPVECRKLSCSHCSYVAFSPVALENHRRYFIHDASATGATAAAVVGLGAAGTSTAADDASDDAGTDGGGGSDSNTDDAQYRVRDVKPPAGADLGMMSPAETVAFINGAVLSKKAGGTGVAIGGAKIKSSPKIQQADAGKPSGHGGKRASTSDVAAGSRPPGAKRRTVPASDLAMGLGAADDPIFNAFAQTDDDESENGPAGPSAKASSSSTAKGAAKKARGVGGKGSNAGTASKGGPGSKTGGSKASNAGGGSASNANNGGGNVLFICLLCGSSTRYKNNMKQHIIKGHNALESTWMNNYRTMERSSASDTSDDEDDDDSSTGGGGDEGGETSASRVAAGEKRGAAGETLCDFSAQNDLPCPDCEKNRRRRDELLDQIKKSKKLLARVAATMIAV